MFADNLARKLIDANFGIPVQRYLQDKEMDALEGFNELELVTDICQFKFDSDKNLLLLEVGPDTYSVDYSGYNKIGRFCGFPESVIREYPVPMMLEPINWKFPQKAKELKAFVKNRQIVAFVAPGAEFISTKRLVEIVDKAAAGYGILERIDHNMSFTNINILVPSHSMEWEDDRIKEDYLAQKIIGRDLIVGGVNFQGSITDEHPVVVAASIYRPKCTNGMLTADSLFKWNRKNTKIPIYDWFEEKVTTAVEMLAEELRKFAHLREVIVPDDEHRLQMINSIFKEFNISDKLRSMILQDLVANPPRNMFDIVNSVTAIASNAELEDSPQMIRKIHYIGGQIARDLHVCEKCFSVTR